MHGTRYEPCPPTPLKTVVLLASIIQQPCRQAPVHPISLQPSQNLA